MIITLTTDIGWEYAAEMKGVIYSINPNVTIVDVTHDIQPQNIRQGAFVLYCIAPYFKNAIHVGVVDPGVGTERKAIVIKTKNAWFIGPDNGLFWPAASREGIEKIYELLFDDASPVFHGRDVFAPAAALISAGKKPKWKEIDNMKKLEFPEAITEGNKIVARIIYIDKFGNMITNAIVKGKKKIRIKIGEKTMKIRCLPSYGYAEKGEIIAVGSSTGFTEIAMREGNAAKYFNAKEDDVVEIFL